MPRLITAKEVTHRFEMVEGTHSKFWEYKRVGKDFLASWGKIGKRPQGNKMYSEAEIARLVQEKLKKGYEAI
jgi:predicted DNA-binding WGR domain protein